MPRSYECKTCFYRISHDGFIDPNIIPNNGLGPCFYHNHPPPKIKSYKCNTCKHSVINEVVNLDMSIHNQKIPCQSHTIVPKHLQTPEHSKKKCLIM